MISLRYKTDEYGREYKLDWKDRRIYIVRGSDKWIVGYIRKASMDEIKKNVILNTLPELNEVSDVFHSSYTGKRGINLFPVVTLSEKAKALGPVMAIYDRDRTMKGYYIGTQRQAEMHMIKVG